MPEDWSSTSSSAARRLWLLLALGGAVLLALAACGPTPSARPAAPAPPTASLPAIDVRLVRRALTASEAEDYLGDAACASCHRDIGAAHARSAHARTLRAVTLPEDGPRFRHSNAVRDRKSHFNYAAVVRDNRCQLLAFNSKVEATLPADFAIGSGHHAISYLNRDDRNGWVALRLSYYPQARRWDFSAGQPPDRPLSTPMGIELNGAQVTACLLCHTTVVRTVAPVDAILRSGAEAFPDVAASRPGIGCERCHGPGRAHVTAVMHAPDPALRAVSVAKRAGNTFGMEDLGRATPQRINTLCGYCHRTPENTDARDPHNEMDTARFEGVALARSACYQQSNALSCITCHDPHADADSSLARNDAICLRCHATAADHRPAAAAGVPAAARAGKICPVNPRSGCTTCHMPRQKIEFGAGVSYTNHWIKVWPKSPHAAN
jgi:predicted CXXCH cytochrome family protein